MATPTPPPPGIYVPAVLFFQENEDFDIPAIKSHILRLAQGGVTGILVQGSNGEAQHLSHDERKEAIRITRETLNENGFQNVLVIAGTGAQSTRETKKICQDAKDAGASHALVLTPSTWPPQMSKDNIIRFHRDVADASPIPTMIYNFPVVTAGLDLDSDIIATLARHPNIVGTKLSCGNVGKMLRLTSLYPSSEFAVFAGRSDVFIPGVTCGTAGVIGALVNLLPKIHSEIYALYKKDGMSSEVLRIQRSLARADWTVQKLGGIGGLKAVIWRNFWYGGPSVRGPLGPVEEEKLTGAEYDHLEELLEREKRL